MKSGFTTFAGVLLALFSLGAGAIPQSIVNTPLYQTGPAIVKHVMDKVEANGGCNLNVCFALDGSGSLSSNYETQKTFVNLVSAVIGAVPQGADPEVYFSAVQYGLVPIPISDLTDDAAQFLKDVDRSKFANARRTFISPGIAYCCRELDKMKGEANKIVLLGDGKSNFGDLEDGPLSAAGVAKTWKKDSPGNDICAVAVGFASIKELTKITCDNPKKVLQVTEWLKLLNILDKLVTDICGLDGPVVTTKPPVVTTKPPTTIPPTTKPPTTRPPTTKPRCPCFCFKATGRGHRFKKNLRKARKHARNQCRGKRPCRVKKCHSGGGFWCC